MIVASVDSIIHLKYYMFVLCAVSLNSFILLYVYKYMPVILQEGNSLSVLRHLCLNSLVMPK
jgi:hypothetical protein